MRSRRRIASLPCPSPATGRSSTLAQERDPDRVGPRTVRAVTEVARTVARVLLGLFLLVAGTAHLVIPDEFLAQVPPFLPAPGAIVLVSGLVELAAGAAVLLTPARRRPWVGLAVAALFVVVFPGNVSQYVTGTDAFGLDTDGARATRLVFQPVLVAWAVWACGAWPLWRRRVSLPWSPGSAGPGGPPRPSP